MGRDDDAFRQLTSNQVLRYFNTVCRGRPCTRISRFVCKLEGCFFSYLLCAQLSAQLHEKHDILAARTRVEFPCLFLLVVRSSERTPMRGDSNDSNMMQPLIHSIQTARGASWSKFGASDSDSFLRTRSKTFQSQRSRPMRNSTLAGCPRKRV